MINLNLQENELYKICDLLQLPKNPTIYLLSGNLASGKTTLVKAFVKALNKDCVVTSPTYLIAQSYGEQIFHYDIYQKSLSELLNLGFLEEIEKEGWHFIEWGDENLATILRKFSIPFISIEISSAESGRNYRIEGLKCTS